MATIRQLTGFFLNEEIVIELFAENPDGSTLTDPANQTVEMVITDADSTTTLVSVDGPPQVVLADEPTAKFIITLDAVDDLSSLVADVPYQYTIWSKDAGGDRKAQVSGRLKLNPARVPPP